MTNKEKIPFGLVFLAILSFIVGFAGFVLHDPFWFKSTPQSSIQSALDAFYAVLQTFVLDGPKTLTQQGPFGPISWIMINIARILAPLSLAGALIGALSVLWRPFHDRWRLAFMRNHFIVMGSNELARAFIANALNSSRKIVCIVSSEQEKTSLMAQFDEGVLIQVANPSVAKYWHRVSVQRATDILLAEKQDSINLSVMNLLKPILEDVLSSAQNSTLFVHIGDEPLRNELISQTGHFASKAALEIVPFGVNELSARYFFHHRNFFYDTKTAGFQSVHWLVFGLNNSSIALMRQFLKISDFVGLEKPHISFVVPDPQAAETQILALLGGQGVLANIHVYQSVGCIAQTGLTLIENIGRSAAVSSVFISLDSPDANQKCAAHLQGISTRTGQLKANIYLDELQECVNWMQVKGKEKIQPSVCSLASAVEYCSLKYLKGSHDIVARAFHQAYASKNTSAPNWQQLDENFKQANRRAADHAKTKMESLGFLGNLDQLTYEHKDKLEISCAQVELLAQAEHNSWMADRMLNGWQHSSRRDNSKRLHTDLVSFDKLSEEVKTLDRQQVKSLLNDVLKPAKSSETAGLKRNIRVALIGHNAIFLADANKIKQQLRENILPDLAKNYSHANICFFTPLAPGSDLVLSDAIVELFPPLHKNWSLQIIQIMPIRHIVRHYESNWQHQFTWDGIENNSDPKSWSQAKEEILARLESLPKSISQPLTSIDLMPPFVFDSFWDEAINSQNAFVRGANYMADNADIVIAFMDEKRKSGAGGTAQTLERARNKNIPVFII